MKVQRDYVLVKPMKAPEESNKLIYTPDTAQKSTLFEVVGVGPGAYYGQLFVETQVKVGQKVVLTDSYNRQEVEVKGEKLLVVREPDVVLVLE